MEVAMMDKRISELRERLYGKKIQACRGESFCEISSRSWSDPKVFIFTAMAFSPSTQMTKCKLALTQKNSSGRQCSWASVFYCLESGPLL